MEEAINARVVTLSELLRRTRPVTATSFLLSNSSHHRPIPPSSSSTRPFDSPSFNSPNPNPKVLTPLSHPATLNGTLTLLRQERSSSSTLNHTCSKINCFVFTDDDSYVVCCDVISFDVRMIGKKICVISWNFIPFKGRGACLEIIKWRFYDSSFVLSRDLAVDSFSLVSDNLIDCKEDLKAHYLVHGVVDSVSFVSVVPCSTSRTGNGLSNVRGFLVQMMVCECKLCRSKESLKGLNDSIHYFTKLVIVYFIGAASSWHPVMTKLVGNVVALSGLKKKMVFIGKEESHQLMYVTTEKTFLHVSMLLNRYHPSGKTIIKGKGECAAYTGIVSGIYMQGMVVELDKEVWLLLTDCALTLPHTLRVGAIISVKNVHFVIPNFSWTKILILGACSRTSINVESFSPLETGCCIAETSQSLLMKYIDSLAFSARLWVLLVVSCFRKKFAGYLSEKEILGSKHKEGLVQAYARSILPSSVLQSRHGVFMEFCRHELNECGSEPDYYHPKLVLPVSHFVSHSKAICTKMKSQFEKDCEKTGNSKKLDMLSCEGKSYCQSQRRILSSDEIGIILLGSLKISPSSGKLQLVDASGGVDVLIPDLTSFLKAGSIYELNTYKLVMEGIHEQADHSRLVDTKSFSCRHIFHSFPLAKQTGTISTVYFHMQNSSSSNRLIYPGIDLKETIEKPMRGTFHLVRVTHKFPLLQKLEGDSDISNMSSAFAEALILPWDLFLDAKDRDTHTAKTFEDEQKKLSGDQDRRNYDDHVPSKRLKVGQASNDSMRLGVIDYTSDAQRDSEGILKLCSRKCGGIKESLNKNSLLKIPCLATISIYENHSIYSGFLNYTKINVNAKVLLEFKAESYDKYQLLQIGGYYITKCCKEDLCSPKDCEIASGIKVEVTLETYLWSLSFSPHEILSYIDPSYDPLTLETCIKNNGDILDDSHQIELLVQNSTNNYEPITDRYVHSSASVLLSIDHKVLEEGGIKTGMTKEKVVGTTMATSNHISRITDSDCMLPDGDLISLQGHVEAIHNLNCNSFDAHENLGYVQQLKYSKGHRSSICIYVSTGHGIVRIVGSPTVYANIVGFGPGVDATFYRILQLRQNDFLLTPISYAVISWIRVVNNQPNQEYYNLCFASNLSKAAMLDTSAVGLISDMIQSSECPLTSRSRVLAIYMLVLEKNKKYVGPQPRVHKVSVNIPLAGFVLDDGLSLCCCWASGERASTLLRLHEKIRPKTLVRDGWMFKNIGVDGACNTAIHYVNKILEKHGRITVKNYGSIFDSSFQDLTFSASSNDVLSSTDENLLKLIIFNASFGTVWNCRSKVMDSNAALWLEKNLMELEMPLLCMPNIWVGDVCHANYLAEARKVITDLQKG